MQTSRYTYCYKYKTKEDKGPIIDPTLYKKLVGSLKYLKATRLDITYGVNLISRFMESPKGLNWKTRKRILRYITGIEDYGILYLGSDNNSLIGYIDSHFVRNLDDQNLP